jgi:undecaprenyl diphosphate synthase
LNAGRVVLEHNLPLHIAIVMDGNGRWAENRGLARIEGHKAGVASVRKIISCCLEKKISCLSLFAFSSENWLRPAEEVNFLMELFIESLRNELQSLAQYGIKLRFTGDRRPLSSALQIQMHEAETITRSNQGLILNLVVNYGGKWDILNGAKKMVQEVVSGNLKLDDIDEVVFTQCLNTKDLPEPDLFIRTSGELRISNFFLWQLAYTELYFTDVHWPDFDEQQFELALTAFAKRKRRFGQIT